MVGRALRCFGFSAGNPHPPQHSLVSAWVLEGNVSTFPKLCSFPEKQTCMKHWGMCPEQLAQLFWECWGSLNSPKTKLFLSSKWWWISKYLLALLQDEYISCLPGKHEKSIYWALQSSLPNSSPHIPMLFSIYFKFSQWSLYLHFSLAISASPIYFPVPWLWIKLLRLSSFYALLLPSTPK